jgi:arylsulfatase A-like enzyme
MKCLILSVAGLRLDCLGCYGSDWVDTPNLDRLAAASVVFDQHFAENPDHDGAYRAWLAGEGNLVQRLSAVGIGTRLVCDKAVPPPAVFTDGFQKARFVQGGAKQGARQESVLDAARKAAGSLARREKALLCVDVPTLLPPWSIPEEFLDLYFPAESESTEEEVGKKDALVPWTEPLPPTVAGDDEATLLRLRRTYAAAVSHFDAHFGLLLDSLEEEEGAQDWMVILTAPYGLPLGDHGIAGSCRPLLHEELVHLPLLVRLPGAAEAGRRVYCLTQTSDLAATLLDAIGLPVSSMYGRSLLPLCRGEANSIRAEAYSKLRTATAEEWALRTSEWAFLLPVNVSTEDPSRGPQLYVKPDDRFEVNNVVQHHSELAEEMERKLRTVMKGYGMKW